MYFYASGYSDADSEIDDETQCHVNLSVSNILFLETKIIELLIM